MEVIRPRAVAGLVLALLLALTSAQLVAPQPGKPGQPGQPGQAQQQQQAPGAVPHTQPTLSDMLGPSLLKAPSTSNEHVDTAKAMQGKIVGLYFAADWCPPCRQFTPVLKKYYNRVRFRRRNFEVVWLSASRSEDGYDGYRKEMPWLALPYAERERFQQLRELYRVESFPTLLFVDGQTGQVLAPKARDVVMRDPNGDGFPYLTPLQMFTRTLKGVYATFVPRSLKLRLKAQFGLDWGGLD